MIIILTGASHTGKTLLSQRMMEKYKIPYISIDHLKMGLIRSGNTSLTPNDDEEMTTYIWPIVREMIKTAIENKQSLIVEGCYIPYEWRKDFSEEYLKNIRFICLVMTDKYIDAHFDEIRNHASDIEERLDDSDLTIDWIKAENKRFADGFKAVGEETNLIDTNYEQALEKACFLIPDNIKKMIAGKEYIVNDIGMSGSRVMIFDDCVLKILDSRLYDDEPSVRVMNWLDGKIPAPKALAFEKDENYQYLLMSRIPGEMSCSDFYLEHPEELVTILAGALKMLWSVDISDCPKYGDLDDVLKQARYRVENNLVDIMNAEPETYGENGFENPTALIEWLENNKPVYEPVLSHGDFCLPNIFIKDGNISGFIDVGRTGVGDKWNDIAICYRSLKHNFDGTYGGKIYPDFDPDMLFVALGIEPNWEKINFFILLDELF